jgi:gluconolactonase
MTQFTRRSMVAGAALLAPSLAFAQGRPQLGGSPSVISTPPRDFGPDAPPDVYPDPDVLVIDPSFGNLMSGHGAIKRLGTGYQWAEGPAWNGQGQYVVFSDVMGDVQYRYIWDSGLVLPFRRPSFNSNGNTFDFQGRQISGQDFPRRVVRWEHDGSMTIIADSYQGKPLNSPNDFAAHPDGSIWFTDPYYGAQLSEGHPDEGEGPMNAGGLRDPRIGNSGAGLLGGLKQTLPTNVYRWDPSGRLEVVATGKVPNGICFSPDYKRLYLVWGPDLAVADVQGTKLANLRTFSDCMVDGVKCGPDGMRTDRAGNVWSGSTSVPGYNGVTVWNPAGKLIGRIRLPEVCANLCFAGPKRDYLFMTASQSVYLLRVNIQGAGP